MCALLLYPNGVTESVTPENLTFTEQEILGFFSEFKEVKTYRIVSVLNSWCVYGIKESKPIDYNKIISEIVQTEIYFHVLFIHDSELQPDWKVSDDVLYNGYNEFLKSLLKLLDDTAIHIMSELTESAFDNDEEYASKLPSLVSLGVDKDNKVIFGFDLEKQKPTFFLSENFYEFSKKVFTYIGTHKQTKKPFVIYSDKNATVVIEPKKVVHFLTALLELFKSKEDYEICIDINNIIQLWEVNEAKKKSRRKPKISKNPSNE